MTFLIIIFKRVISTIEHGVRDDGAHAVSIGTEKSSDLPEAIHDELGGLHN